MKDMNDTIDSAAMPQGHGGTMTDYGNKRVGGDTSGRTETLVNPDVDESANLTIQRSIGIWSWRSALTDAWAHPPRKDSAGQSEEDTPQGSGVPSLFSKTPLVLVVEDDDDALISMIELLENQGYATVGTGDGIQAMRFLDATLRVPNLILLDLTMPNMDGFQFRTALLKSERLSTIPIVVVTARHDAMDQAADIRAAGLVRKPVHKDSLLNVVERIIKLRLKGSPNDTPSSEEQ